LGGSAVRSQAPVVAVVGEGGEKCPFRVGERRNLSRAKLLKTVLIVMIAMIYANTTTKQESFCGERNIENLSAVAYVLEQN
jgi:hypothetical protein